MRSTQEAKAPKTPLRSDLAPLFRAQPVPFSEWRVAGLPRDSAGVYTIWRRDEFVYVGISANLVDRLRSHASGRRSGDQFCVYVCDRLVVPALTRPELSALAAGKLSLDVRTREFIQRNLSFRSLVTRDVATARGIEAELRGGIAGFEQPLLNPLAERSAGSDGE